VDIPNITLYHVPFTRSTRVLWLLKEIGGEVLNKVDVKRPSWDFVKSKEYFALNPNRLIPAATISNGSNAIPMFEAGAIMRYICEQVAPHYPIMKTLFPTTWTKENWLRHYIYSYWTIVHLDKEIVANFFGVSRITGKISGKVEKWFQKVVAPKILADLADNDYINGPTFTCTDIYLGYTLMLASNLGLFPKTGKIGTYYTRLAARDSLQQLLSEK